MLRWFLVLGLLFLAACQQSPATTAKPDALQNLDKLPDDWSASGAAKESKYFASEQKDVSNRLAANLFINCYRHAGDKAALDGCLREGLVDTFDDSGQGRANCKSLSDLDAFTDCIILGNAAVDTLKRMDSKVRIDASAWAGRRSFADVMSKAVITSGIMACSDAKTEAAAEICVFEWYRKALAVPDSLAKKCTTDLDEYERGSCLGEASIINFLREHVARMPGVGI